MKFHKYGFIGHEDTNVETEWSGGDNLQNFERSLRADPNWHFKDRHITYKINSLGHRSKEIEEINLDNYILFIGCSHTEGIGLGIEYTYPHLVSQQLNCDYYNLGLGATGIDVVVHNLVIWFTNIEKKPKLVVIQWPDPTRVTTGTSCNHLTPRGMWENTEDFNKFVHHGFEVNFFEGRKLLANTIVQNMIKVPVIYFGIEKVMPFNDYTVMSKIIDKARDNGHAGIQSHILFAQLILDSL
jgi:hypothetical protein